MKEVKHYICELCGTEYNDKLKAQNCEKGHKTAIEIVGQKFVSISNDKTGYPMRIDVKMSDGNTFTYKR